MRAIGTVVQTLLAKPVTQIPDGDRATLHRGARDCRAWPLWKHATLYLTNTVKHFKYESRGKVRLHKRANAAEMTSVPRCIGSCCRT